MILIPRMVTEISKKIYFLIILIVNYGSNQPLDTSQVSIKFQENSKKKKKSKDKNKEIYSKFEEKYKNLIIDTWLRTIIRIIYL